MSTPASAVPTSPSSKIRPSANYHPTLWGDYFLTCASETIDIATQEHHEALTEEVRRMIESSGGDSPVAQKVLLQLIDTIQRLGVAYHFKKEIEDALFKMIDREIDDNDDLYTVSLRFRLFRQQGIMISSDVFNKFKDEEGKYFFKESLIKNVEDMLSLYEATYLSIRGEEILGEALAFTTTQLKSMVVDQIHPNLAKKINQALYSPLHKSVPRFEARDFFDMYAREDFHNQTLLKFAKLDFNVVQAQYQNELSVLTRWWRELDFSTKVPYARDRLVELYFWTMEMFIEPEYAFGRIILTKINCMVSIMDDTFDAYGTFEELQIFTKAIKRWDLGVIDTLPKYMKIIYRTLLDIYNDIEEELGKEERSHCIPYAKEKMQELIEMYFEQAKWLNGGCITPTMEEYMSVALTSIGCVLNLTICFLGMGDLATEDTFKLIFANPKILTAASLICRFMNDVAGHEFEQKRGHVASAVECCMKQYSVSEEAAVKMLKQEVANAWKDMNEELILMKNTNNPRAVPFPLLESILNLVRACDYIYKDGERYLNNYLMKDKIASVLKDPVIL